ncbi:hypothetical protein M407DRAFT_21601 [Tulasnella calospora MUT 4182]|uniref:Uncharacterized protein n=1 Tax=Tulasnella calospora MUT 4182 TaxID=1051891 RepID=A0A0C3QMR0_9AGAM|nr:hypothetical protein M407DRAFT_21601 [Tulasnella calospora MUT 4182]
MNPRLILGVVGVVATPEDALVGEEAPPALFVGEAKLGIELRDANPLEGAAACRVLFLLGVSSTSICSLPPTPSSPSSSDVNNALGIESRDLVAARKPSLLRSALSSLLIRFFVGVSIDCWR